MESIIRALVKAASTLDETNHQDIADEVDKIASSILDIKTAQYVGIQGYWIRNSRCFGNCWRQKRAKTPTKAAQEIWNECHEEYVKSINNDGSAWDKYAESEASSLMKMAESPEYEVFEKRFKEMVTSGSDTGSAIFGSINFAANRFEEEITEHTAHLAKLAERTLSVNPDVAVVLSQASKDLIKEAQVLRNMWDRFRGRGSNFGKADYNLDPNTLERMITELGTTLSNYSQQRRKILDHLKSVAQNAVQKPYANEVARILTSGPLTREAIAEIQKQLGAMKQEMETRGSSSTLPPGPVAPSPSATSPSATSPSAAPAAPGSETPDINLAEPETPVPPVGDKFDVSQGITRQTILENKPLALQVVKKWQQENPDQWRQIVDLLKKGQSQRRDLIRVAKAFNFKKYSGIRDDVNSELASKMKTMLDVKPQDFIDALFSQYPNIDAMIADISKADGSSTYGVEPSATAPAAPVAPAVTPTAPAAPAAPAATPVAPKPPVSKPPVSKPPAKSKKPAGGKPLNPSVPVSTTPNPPSQPASAPSTGGIAATMPAAPPKAVRSQPAPELKPNVVPPASAPPRQSVLED